MAHNVTHNLLGIRPPAPPKKKPSQRTPDQRLREPIRFEDGSVATRGDLSARRFEGLKKELKTLVPGFRSQRGQSINEQSRDVGNLLLRRNAIEKERVAEAQQNPPARVPTPPPGVGFDEAFPGPTPERALALQKVLDTEFDKAIEEVRLTFGADIADSIPRPETTDLGLRGATGIARGIDFNNPGPFGLGLQNFIDRAQHAIEALPGEIEGKLPAALTFDKAIEVSEDIPFEHAPLTVRHEISHHILDRLQVGGDRNTRVEGDDHHTIIREAAGLGTTGVNFQQLQLETEALQNPSPEADEAAAMGQFRLTSRAVREGTLRKRTIASPKQPGQQEQEREFENFRRFRDERLGRLQAEGREVPTFEPTPTTRPEPREVRQNRFNFLGFRLNLEPLTKRLRPLPAPTPKPSVNNVPNSRNILGMNL